MPSIASRTIQLDPEQYQPSAPNKLPSYSSVDQAGMNLQPGMNVNLRCSLPPIFASVDGLRQFYFGGAVPQYRVLPAPPLSSN